MKNPLTAIALLLLSSSGYAELDAPQVASEAATSFITGYTLTRSRAAELVELGKLWDGHHMNVVRGDIGEAIAERAFFGGPELARSKKGTWVSIAPRFKRQGIDHVFVRVDKNGLPNNMILGESKYGSSQPNHTKKSGKQMGNPWRMERLTAIGERYFKFANSAEPIIRTKVIPIGAKSVDVFFSKTHKVTIWEESGKWYTNAEGITDRQLRIRAMTYGKYFSSAGRGIIRTRNFLFKIQEQKNGDYLVKISPLTDSAEIVSTRKVVIPKEFATKGRVDIKTLKNALKRKHPSWSEEKIAQEAKDIQKVVSNRDFLDAANANRKALTEIKRSSITSAGIAGVLSLVLQLGAEAWEHGTDFKAYDLEGVAKSTLKGAVTTGLASFAGQRTALYLAGKTVFKRQISIRAAGRIGGGVGAAILLAESFGGCVIGNKNWKEGSIEAGIGAASMIAGHYAALGVSTLIASSTAAGTTVGTVGVATAGTVTAASTGTAGTIAGAGAVGASAGTAGSGGIMAIATAAGPVLAAVVVGTAISYGGYVLYDHYKNIELVKGEFRFNEKKLEMFFDDEERYIRSMNQMLGL